MKTIKVGKIDASIKPVLERLNNFNLEYYVVGGLLCQFYLKDHARYTKDVDILFNNDPQEVELKLKETFGKIDFFYSKGTDSFYEENFTGRFDYKYEFVEKIAHDGGKSRCIVQEPKWSL